MNSSGSKKLSFIERFPFFRANAERSVLKKSMVNSCTKERISWPMMALQRTTMLLEGFWRVKCLRLMRELSFAGSVKCVGRKMASKDDWFFKGLIFASLLCGALFFFVSSSLIDFRSCDTTMR